MNTLFSFKRANINFFFNLIGILLFLGLAIYAPNLLVLFLISFLSGFALYLSFFYNSERSLGEGILISIMLTTYVFVFVQVLKIFSITIYPWILFLLFLIFPLAIILFHYKKLIIYFKKETYAQNIDLFYISLIALICVLFFSIYLTGDYLPREDGPSESYLGLKIKNELANYNTIYHWVEDFFVGVPQLPLESVSSYYRMGITSLLNIFNSDYYKDIANLQIVFTILLVLGAYLSFRAAGIRENLSFFGILALFTTDFFTSAVGSNIRKIFPVALMPLILLLMIKTLKGKNEIMLIFLASIAIVFHHPIFGVGALMLSSIFLAIFLFYNAKFKFFNKQKEENRGNEKNFKKFILKLILIGILLFGLLAFYVYNLYTYLPGEIPRGIDYSRHFAGSNPISNILKAILNIFSVVKFDSYRLFGYFMLIATAYLLFALKKDAGKYRILTTFSMMLGIYILVFYLGLTISPTLSLVDYARLIHLIFPIVILFFLFLLGMIKKPFRALLSAISALIIIYLLFASIRPDFVKELYNPMGNDHRNEIPIELKQYMPNKDSSRFALYCMNYFAKAPEILLRTDLGTSEGNIWEIQSLLSWRLKHMFPRQSNRILPRLDHSPVYWKNFMRITNTRYAIANYCSCPVNLAPFFANNYVKPALASQCLNIYEVDTGAFAEKVVLSYPAEPINDGLDYSTVNINDNPLYDLESGYKHIFPKEINEFLDSGKNIVVIHNETELNSLPEPVALKTEKISDEHYAITGNFNEGDFISIKINHFPMWKAYMSGKPLRIYESNVEIILIEANKGKKIELIYEQPLTNKFLYILFLLSFISLLLLARNFEKSMPENLSYSYENQKF